MLALTLAALAGTTQAAMYTWSGPALNFDAAGSWTGGSNPVSGTVPSSVTFGSMTGPVTAALSGQANVGNRLDFVGTATIVFSGAGASINFGNGAGPQATYLPASSDFRVPSSDQTLGGTAAAYQWNCPLNWRVGGQVPIVPPGPADTVTIAPSGFYVSTFGQVVQASSLNSFSASSSPALCLPTANAQALSISGNPGSTVSWGGSTCPNIFTPQGRPQASCGNLVMSSLTGRLPNTVVQVFTCPGGATACGPLANQAVVINNASGTAMAGSAATATVGAGGALSVPGATDGTVKYDPTVGAWVKNDANAGSDSSDDGPSTLLIIVIIIAVVVIVAVAGVMYVKKKQSPPPQQSGARGFGGVGFENPLYDENPQKSAGGGPQYADAPQGDSDYMDMPATDGQQDTGYMDVPAEGDGGGYLDVDAEDGDEDNF